VKENVFEFIVKCSKCQHNGKLYIKDKMLRDSLNKRWWEIFVMAYTWRLILIICLMFTLGLAVGWHL